MIGDTLLFRELGGGRHPTKPQPPSLNSTELQQLQSLAQEVEYLKEVTAELQKRIPVRDPLTGRFLPTT